MEWNSIRSSFLLDKSENIAVISRFLQSASISVGRPHTRTQTKEEDNPQEIEFQMRSAQYRGSESLAWWNTSFNKLSGEPTVYERTAPFTTEDEMIPGRPPTQLRNRKKITRRTLLTQHKCSSTT